MLVSRVKLGDLVALGAREDWSREELSGNLVPASPDEYIVIWESTDRRIPETIVVPTSLPEFYAWSSTYLAHLTPISSLVRVAKVAARAQRKGEFPYDRAVGLIFAEVAASREAHRFSSATVADYVSTLSFTLARATCYDNMPRIEEIASLWVEARQLLSVRRPPFAVEHLLEVWQDSGGGVRPARKSPISFQQNLFVTHAADIPESASASLDRLEPALADGPIEDRIRAFKTVTRRVVAEGRDRRYLAPLLGAALSKVSRGTFRHTHLLGPAEVPDVRALLWYGWFEARAAAEIGHGWFGEADGFRLRVEVLRRWNRDGTEGDYDIAIEELRLIPQEGEQRERLTNGRRGLRVQLCEGLVAEFPIRA